MVKNLPALQEAQVLPLGQGDSLQKEMAAHSGTSPRKPHRHRSLASCSPWGRKGIGQDSETKLQQTTTVNRTKQ